MEMPALREVGNAMASFFLNAVAGNAGVTLHPSPPAVMMDMAGAVLDIALSQIMEHSDDTFIVRSSFRANDQEVDGDFLVLRSPELLNILQLERPGS
jgi:chemotaxis protein CheC